MRLIDADALIDRIKNPYEQAQVARWVNEQPTIEPEKHTEKRTETHACDLIDREAAVDAIYHHLPSVSRTRARTMLHEVPSARPEPLSDAYMKSVWTWLLEYQIKAAELKGRYTPYEVLSWVVNDWRKEHEGSD